MSAGAPWSVKGIDPKAREVAKDLARRSGMTLGEWLNRVILEDDLPEDLTVETQFTDRLHRLSGAGPRFSVVPATPDLSRVAFALDRVTDRIESSETRTGLAINGVEHSVRQALARIETAEREQYAAVNRLEAQLVDARLAQSDLGERLFRLESEAAGPRSAEALRLMDVRLAKVEPEALTRSVLEHLGKRLALAEARTTEALENLQGALGALDRRLTGVESGAEDTATRKFEDLGQALTLRVEAVRAEVAEKLEASSGPAFEARFAEMAQTVRDAERRATQAVEAIGHQVLSMAEAVSRKLGDVDQRSADAIDQVGSEVARIAGAVELRLARGEHAQAEAFERFGAELAKVSETLAKRFSVPQDFLPLVIEEAAVATVLDKGPDDVSAWCEPDGLSEAQTPSLPEPDPQTAALLAEARDRLGPPPEPEPEPEFPDRHASPAMSSTVAVDGAPGPLSPDASAPFGLELFSRVEVEDPADPDTLDAPWRRLELDLPVDEAPGPYVPLNDTEDEALFVPTPVLPHRPALSTREVIDRARAAARAANATGQVDVSAKVESRAATGRLFQGFGAKTVARRPSTTLQTALLIAGGSAFLSAGAAGLMLMQGPTARPSQQAATTDEVAYRAAVARVAEFQAPSAATAALTAPVYERVRADVEAGVPGAVAQLKALAASDHPQAQLFLGQLYDLGEAGLDRNPVEARRLISLSAENGDLQAMHNLGVFFFRGEGGPQDLTSAALWFRKAADGGIIESQYNLGLLYQSGSGVRRDLNQARRWFAKAAARGDAEARRALAAMTPASGGSTFPMSVAAQKPAVAPSQNVRQTQFILSQRGYYDGPADGVATNSYRSALVAYQRDMTDQRSGPRPDSAHR